MSSYLDRYMPRSDYLASKYISSALVRRRIPQSKFTSLRKERPKSLLLFSTHIDDSDSVHLPAIYGHTHLSRRELPLCTPTELLEIIRKPNGYYEIPTDPWNEVYPNIFISDAPTALCTSVLRRMGVSHVLNAAQGKEKHCGLVNTWAGYYIESGIEFLGVPAFDNIVFRIHPYFEGAADFIERALKTGGKVLVHCQCGISRSATLVVAFLMLKRNMSVQEALTTIREQRAIIPNDGFLQQLCDLNDKLKRRRMGHSDVS